MHWEEKREEEKKLREGKLTRLLEQFSQLCAHVAGGAVSGHICGLCALSLGSVVIRPAAGP